jgi:hypothetical protein
MPGWQDTDELAGTDGLSLPLAVYPAMLGGTIAGQFVGMGFDALALGTHVLWVPLACSVVLEAAVAARYGAARMGHPLTRSQRGRLSIYYSLGLAGLSLPLAGWLAVSKASREDAPGVRFAPHDVAVWAAILLAGLVVYTALRYALMTAFAPRPA